MTYLLDTSALLAHHRKEPGWAEVQAVFSDTDSEVLLAGVSLTEFARRLTSLGASESEARDSASLYAMLFDEIVAVDRDIAMAAFAIACNTPGRLPLVDSLIAAAAQSRSARLVHRDTHMADIPSSLLEQSLLPKKEKGTG